MMIMMIIIIVMEASNKWLTTADLFARNRGLSNSNTRPSHTNKKLH
jgi:hypothetical protein